LLVVTNKGGYQVFARIKESRNSDYLQIVENYREGEKVRQRMVLYVGPYGSVDEALERMPRDIGDSRRRAAKLEKAYEVMYGASVGDEVEKHGAQLKRQAERERREAEDLGSRLEALKRLVQENPDLASSDRVRAARHARRRRETFAEKLATLKKPLQ
jgi:hypothetical protein